MTTDTLPPLPPRTLNGGELLWSTNELRAYARAAGRKLLEK